MVNGGDDDDDEDLKPTYTILYTNSVIIMIKTCPYSRTDGFNGLISESQHFSRPKEGAWSSPLESGDQT